MTVGDDIKSLHWLAQQFDQISSDFLSDFRDINSIQHPIMKIFANAKFRSDIPKEQRLQNKRKIKSHLYKQKWVWKSNSGTPKRMETNGVVANAIRAVYATDLIACGNALQALGMSESYIKYLAPGWRRELLPLNRFDFLFTGASELGVKPACRKDRRTILNVFADLCRAKIHQLEIGRNQSETPTPAKKNDLLDQLDDEQKAAIKVHFHARHSGGPDREVPLHIKGFVLGLNILKAKFIELATKCVDALKNNREIDTSLIEELDEWYFTLKEALYCRNQIGLKEKISALKSEIAQKRATQELMDHVKSELDKSTPSREKLDGELTLLIGECKQKTAPDVKASTGESAPVPTATELDSEFYRRADAVIVNAYEAGYLKKVSGIDEFMGYWLRGDDRPNPPTIVGSLPWENLFEQMCDHLRYKYPQRIGKNIELDALRLLRRHIRRQTTAAAADAKKNIDKIRESRPKSKKESMKRRRLAVAHENAKLEKAGKIYKERIRDLRVFCKENGLGDVCDRTIKSDLQWARNNPQAFAQ